MYGIYSLFSTKTSGKFIPLLTVNRHLVPKDFKVVGKQLEFLAQRRCTIGKGSCNLLETARRLIVETFRKSSLACWIGSLLIPGFSLPPR